MNERLAFFSIITNPENTTKTLKILGLGFLRTAGMKTFSPSYPYGHIAFKKLPINKNVKGGDCR